MRGLSSFFSAPLRLSAHAVSLVFSSGFSSARAGAEEPEGGEEEVEGFRGLPGPEEGGVDRHEVGFRACEGWLSTL